VINNNNGAGNNNMTLLNSTGRGGSHNPGRWCCRLATQSRGKAGLFFAVIVGLQNGFYRKQRSPVDGCFSERWPPEPPPEVCNILYPTFRHRHRRGMSDVFPLENYIMNSHASLDLRVSHCQSQCVSGASLSGVVVDER